MEPAGRIVSVTETLIEPGVHVASEALTNAALTDEFLARGDDRSAVVEEPLDTGLWPAVELSEGAVEAFVRVLHQIQLDEQD
jgi:hypothetical protein